MARAVVGHKPYARKTRVASRIQQVLGHYMLTRALDPRLHQVTILEVDCSPDLRQARIRVQVPTTEAIGDTMKALKHAASHLRRFLADSLPLRVVPRLEFWHERAEHIEAKNRLSQLLGDV